MSTREIIDNIQNNKLEEMRALAFSLMAQKAIDRLEEKKISIAESVVGKKMDRHEG